MSRTRVYKRETLEIQQRFFSVIQELIDEKRLSGGLAGYCEDCGIDRRHFYAQRNNLDKGYFEVAWILPLIKHYRVSANWLLFGEGSKYERQRE